MLYGVVGKYSAGKDTVAEYLVKQGFMRISLSDMIADEYRKRYGKPIPDRQSYTVLADEMRTQEGDDVLAWKALEHLKEHDIHDAVIVSIRTPGELRALRNSAHFKLIVVDAPVALRYARARDRKSEKDQVSFEEFKHAEDQESKGIGTHIRLNEVMRYPDILVMNDGSLEELYAQLAPLL